MENQKFGKRKKGIETLFDVIFWIYFIEVLVYFLFKILYIVGVASVDIFNWGTILVLLLCLGFLYLSIRLVRVGHVAAGFIGIVVALAQIFFGGALGIVIGLLLGIDSILYLVNYKK